MRAGFTARPLLNQGEQRLLSVLDKALAEGSPGWRAMGQVSLGEILASPDKDAYFAVNSKRVDLLIVDGNAGRSTRWNSRAKATTWAKTPPPATP